ncbi:MAG: ribulose-phosphate 3-epimerase [Muribaculaceae bacterium]|nr:ribulose-phosphate 3-epimerase [Muribaculaceae bacterium]
MIVSPSLLSADFGNLARDLEMINQSKAQMLHLDVMDGVFVPNISFGFPVIKYVQQLCKKPLDVHLMIVEPQKFVNEVRDCGAEIMNVHYEVCNHLDRVVQQIHDADMKAGVTINPATPVCLLRDIVAQLDLVLLMSVNPGFGGQKFIPNTLNKVRELRALIAETGSKAVIEVDGGVNDITGKQLADAGADVLVAGNYVFKAQDPLKAIETLYNL